MIAHSPTRLMGAVLLLWLSLEARLERRRDRRQLLTLDERALKDFAATRCDAEREAAAGWRPGFVSALAEGCRQLWRAQFVRPWADPATFRPFDRSAWRR